MFYRWNIQQVRRQGLHQDVHCLSQGHMMLDGMHRLLYTLQAYRRAVDSSQPNRDAHRIQISHIWSTDGQVRHYQAAARLLSPLTYQGQTSPTLAVVHQLRSARQLTQHFSDQGRVHLAPFLAAE